ncbi:hypothetical protein [Helicobacter turcicus]|uniref:DUF5666 domain-containing protein n=1 Tax=Helicobacter turcicus TaxID=2867412 RepID=A0ABS7JLT5_9HELI|nr:hypothetical protein [Helicobacter turcicus]MBX7490355.1 hypothetical protein [Helicobacter turcicus]MBX7545066.1 hypothetical protein [Helicobacter turcicus]
MGLIKITLCIAILAVSSLASSFKLQGTIAQTNSADKTIVVDSIYGDSVVVKVLPNTEIDMDNCGVFGIDKYGTFKDLTPGTFVEIKLYFQDFNNGKANPIAREIEIECYKNRAY